MVFYSIPNLKLYIAAEECAKAWKWRLFVGRQKYHTTLECGEKKRKKKKTVEMHGGVKSYARRYTSSLLRFFFFSLIVSKTIKLVDSLAFLFFFSLSFSIFWFSLYDCFIYNIIRFASYLLVPIACHEVFRYLR